MRILTFSLGGFTQLQFQRPGGWTAVAFRQWTTYFSVTLRDHCPSNWPWRYPPYGAWTMRRVVSGVLGATLWGGYGQFVEKCPLIVDT